MSCVRWHSNFNLGNHFWGFFPLTEGNWFWSRCVGCLPSWRVLRLETAALQSQEHKGRHCKSNLCWGFRLNKWPTRMGWRALHGGRWSQFWGLGWSGVSQKADGWLWSLRRGRCPVSSAALRTIMGALPTGRLAAIWRNPLQGRRLQTFSLEMHKASN